MQNIFLAAFLGCVFATIMVRVAAYQIGGYLIRRTIKRAAKSRPKWASALEVPQILFKCEHCGKGSKVLPDRDGLMAATLKCEHCGKETKADEAFTKIA